MDCRACKQPAEWRRKSDGEWYCDRDVPRVGFGEMLHVDESLYDHIDALTVCAYCGAAEPEGTVRWADWIEGKACDECVAANEDVADPWLPGGIGEWERSPLYR